MDKGLSSHLDPAPPHLTPVKCPRLQGTKYKESEGSSTCLRVTGDYYTTLGEFALQIHVWNASLMA